MTTPEHRLARRRALNRRAAANTPTPPGPAETLAGEEGGASPPSVPSRVAPGVVIFLVVLLALFLGLWLFL